jgi:hypothetical protein
MEEENVFNDMLDSAARGLREEVGDRVVKGTIVMLTLGLLAYGLTRLSQARYREEPGIPSLASALAQTALPGDTPDARHQALVEGGDFWEAGRAMARHVLDSAPGPRSGGPRAGDPRPSRPAVRAEGGWWNRWKLRRQAYALWQLAYRTEPVRISSRRLARLRAELEAFKAALASGSVRIDADRGERRKGKGER